MARDTKEIYLELLEQLNEDGAPSFLTGEVLWKSVSSTVESSVCDSFNKLNQIIDSGDRYITQVAIAKLDLMTVMVRMSGKFSVDMIAFLLDVKTDTNEHLFRRRDNACNT